MPKRKGKPSGKGGRKHRNNTSSSSSTRSRNARPNMFGFTKKQQSTLYYILGGFAVIFLFCAFFIYLPSIRSLFGFADTSIDPAKLRGYRARLRRLYEKYNPNKMDEIDDILVKYRGREKELFKKLHHKYVKPNKKVRDERREKERDDRRKRRAGIDPDDVIPENETEEEAAARRRRKKERDREKRKEERKRERGGKDYYDDDEERSNQKKRYNQYFSDEGDDGRDGDDSPGFEGVVELVDDDDDE